MIKVLFGKQLPKSQSDFLRLNANKKQITGGFNIIKFQDKDTLQWVYYIPSLDISSYGEELKKARTMLKQSIDEYFHFLMSKTNSERDFELNSLGWKKDKLHNKLYSKAYIDIDGNLKNFNAVNDKIERLTLETA